ncbi:MAG: oligo,6-glucosidase [Clostridia bacterium]|jgi:oligo-1,6-glucosidase|nr:oligo,6-glucosidase [Clostridia bacterium]
MERKWWKEGVVYQIYPRSFYDSNGDGIGDLKGIIAKIPYLKELGIDIIWLNPIYASPNDDNGYDISDYRSILKEFGSMQDFEKLLNALHQAGIKLIMDLVVNHSSDEHPWFIESKSSKTSPYRDYYIWRKPNEEGKEPNNWRSVFSGSAWQLDEQTGEYYLHLFSKKQPDLNWENEKVRKEVYDMMTWWFEKGIDGFRMDVINFISKVDGLPSASEDKVGADGYAWGGEYFVTGPRVHQYLQEMNKEVLSKYDIMTVGETGDVSPEDGMMFTGSDRDELNMIFQFEHVNLGQGKEGKWTPEPYRLTELKTIMDKWQKKLHGKGWNSLYFTNHDQPRQVSKFGNDTIHRKESAKMLATYLHTLEGTPYIYQGEEIGMTNVQFESLDQYKDLEILNKWEEIKHTGTLTEEELLKGVHINGRDNARTPMQWDESPNAGFTTGEPWIGVNPNYKMINVDESIKDTDSVFHYYKKLLQLRKEHLIMPYGKYQLVLEDHEQIYAYTKTLEDEKWIVILNFGDTEVLFEMPLDIQMKNAKLILANYVTDERDNLDKIMLKPYEARIYAL